MLSRSSSSGDAIGSGYNYSENFPLLFGMDRVKVEIAGVTGIGLTGLGLLAAAGVCFLRQRRDGEVLPTRASPGGKAGKAGKAASKKAAAAAKSEAAPLKGSKAGKASRKASGSGGTKKGKNGARYGRVADSDDYVDSL